MLAEVESLKMRMHGKCGSTASMAVLFVLTLLLPLSACTQRSPSFDYPSDAPVLQINLTGGMVGYWHAAARVPLVTVWENGRVVFVSREERYEPERALIRETQLSKSTVRPLLVEADILHELDDHYSAFAVTDAGTATFSIQSAGGRKTVSVYAFNPERVAPAWRDLEQHTEVMDMLRTLYRTVVDAVPRDALGLASARGVRHSQAGRTRRGGGTGVAGGADRAPDRRGGPAGHGAAPARPRRDLSVGSHPTPNHGDAGTSRPVSPQCDWAGERASPAPGGHRLPPP